MPENIKLEIARESIQSVIEAQVHLAVAQALRPHGDQFVQEIVERALLQKSSADDYRHERDDKKPTVLERMVRKIIAEEARKGIQEWAESHRPQIAENIRKAMASRRFGAKIAAQIARQMAEAHQYYFKLEVNVAKPD